MSKISGFPEYLPHEQIAFSKSIRKLQSHFESFGFVPMDTPAVEMVETLLSKGNDNEIYGLYRLAATEGEKKETNLALRFDLTVPLARYVAQNFGQLNFPYRRYHIAPVWRGERPQKGRYRQFYQCDIDIVGDALLEEEHDAEVLSIAYFSLYEVLNLKNFSIKINSRKILAPLLKLCGFTAEVALVNAMRVLDKIGKIPLDDILIQLKEILDYEMYNNSNNYGIISYEKKIDDNKKYIDENYEILSKNFVFLKNLLQISSITDIKLLKKNNNQKNNELNEKIVDKKNNDELFQILYDFAKSMENKNEINNFYSKMHQAATELLQGLHELKNIIDKSVSLGVDPSFIKFEANLARGLSYYSGIVFEIISGEFPELGTICAGGRYDDLASSVDPNHNKNKKRNFPGVGMSIGISRLLPAIFSQEKLQNVITIANIMIIGYNDAANTNNNSDYNIGEDNQSEKCRGRKKNQLKFYRKIGELCRKKGINIEYCWNKAGNLGKQLKIVDKRGIKVAVIVNDIINTDNNKNINNVVVDNIENMQNFDKKDEYHVLQKEKNVNIADDIVNIIVKNMVSGEQKEFSFYHHQNKNETLNENEDQILQQIIYYLNN